MWIKIDIYLSETTLEMGGIHTSWCWASLYLNALLELGHEQEEEEKTCRLSSWAKMNV